MQICTYTNIQTYKYANMKGLLAKNEENRNTTKAFCTKGSSLMPLIENPSTIDWKSAVFWQVLNATLYITDFDIKRKWQC